jgi:hypothetical protein
LAVVLTDGTVILRAEALPEPAAAECRPGSEEQRYHDEDDDNDDRHNGPS